MTNKQVAIIGLGPVAASIGLALRNTKQGLTIVGTDRDWELATRMQSLGAVDRLARKPAAICKGSGLVIVAEPLKDIAAIFESIADVLSPGCVVTDIAPLKVKVMQWAEEFLPNHVSFIGGHPFILAEEGHEPHPGLFSGIQYALVPASNAQQQGIETVSAMVELMGANTFFLDATEHDGLVTAVEGLPWLLQLALLTALSETGSWRDNQRTASRPFIDATSGLSDDAALDSYMCWLNRQNLVLWIDAYQNVLARIKAMLEAEDETAFQERAAGLYETRRQWLRNRETGPWDTGVPPIQVSKRSIWSQLLWPRLGKKPED